MKRILKVLLTADALLLFGAGLFTPIYAIFVERLNGTIIDVGIAWAIAVFVFATFELPFGRLADRFGKKPFLLVQFFGNAAVFLSLAFITNIMQLFILEFFLGLVNAVGRPAYDGLFSRSLDRGKEASEWGVWEMIAGYAAAASAIIGAALVFYFGFSNLFILISGICFASGLVVLLALKEKHIAGITHYDIPKKHFRRKAG